MPPQWAFVDTYTLAGDLRQRGALSTPNGTLKLGDVRAGLGLPPPGREHRAADDVAVNVGVFHGLAARWLGEEAPGGSSGSAGVMGSSSSISSSGQAEDAAARRQRHLEALVASNSSFAGAWAPLVKYAAIFGSDPAVREAAAAAERVAAAARSAAAAHHAAAQHPVPLPLPLPRQARAGRGAGRAAMPRPAGVGWEEDAVDDTAAAASTAAAAAGQQPAQEPDEAAALAAGSGGGASSDDDDAQLLVAAANAEGSSSDSDADDDEGVTAAVLLPWALDDPAESVEAAVAKGMAALAADAVDVTFDARELAGAWLPFTLGVDDVVSRSGSGGGAGGAAAPWRGALTPAQRDALASAEIRTLLGALLHAPRHVREYARAIDPARPPEEDQLVDLAARIVALGKVGRVSDRPAWKYKATVEVPSPVPGAPAVVLQVLRFFPGRAKWASARADAEWATMEAARMAGLAVALRCRLTNKHSYRGALSCCLLRGRGQCAQKRWSPTLEHVLWQRNTGSLLTIHHFFLVRFHPQYRSLTRRADRGALEPRADADAARRGV